MIKTGKAGMLALTVALGALSLTGCSLMHGRTGLTCKADTLCDYEMPTERELSALSTAFNVSPTQYLKETEIIKLYLTYEAEMGRGGNSVNSIWLLSRQFNMLPSQYIGDQLLLMQQRRQMK